MSLFEDLHASLKQAMLAQRTLERDTLRMVISAAKNLRIELGRDLTDEDVLAVIRKSVKSRQDSAEQYEAGGRPELAAKEEAEIAILSGWLPQLLNEDQTRAAVAAIVGDLGITSKKDMGRVMKELLTRHKGQIDGKLANRVAAELLE